LNTGTGPAIAIDLDGALGDTRPLWSDWVRSVGGVLGSDVASLPSDRAAAAAELDRRGGGNWRTLLERFSEERAAVYLRRDPAMSSALRALAATGRVIGVFTDAPEPLARVALAQLGVDRRVSALESGAGALERLLSRLGPEVVVVRSGAELLAAAESAK
jgi:phosphoglycolate phosphatase-like HAD superfamily hydrolase